MGASERETKSRVRRFLLPAAAFCWPFVYFAPLIVSFGPSYCGIRNAGVHSVDFVYRPFAWVRGGSSR
jgi:hypothetical protein